jgi:hypothetical protein
VTADSTIGLRYATVTDNVQLTVLVNGVERHTLNLPNRGSATAWADAILPVIEPRDATVTVRLNSGDVVWLDYLTPGRAAHPRPGGHGQAGCPRGSVRG